MAQSLTEAQLESLVVIERTSAVLSLVGTALIFTTFCASKKFRTRSNTLIFYASFGNVLSNIAHLVAVDGITAGPNSALCQMQGFLQQMFMPADSLWSLAMASNVYLAFFHQYDSESLRKLHWKYFIACYGIPSVPAVTYLFLKNAASVRVYGGATLWCWIAKEWSVLRLATYYGPLWCVMLVIFAIYLRVGRVIYAKRKELRLVCEISHGETLTSRNRMANVESYTEITANESIYGTKTTEIHVTSDARSREQLSNNIFNGDHTAPHTMIKPNQYSVRISSSFPRITGTRYTLADAKARNHSGMDKALIAYTKCAALFAASLLITWIPSSANRVYGIMYPTRVSYALNVASALVLPLQGFWNGVIYVVTSFAACRALCGQIGFRRPTFSHSKSFLSNLGPPKQETDSTVELSTELGPRPQDIKDCC